MSIKSAINLGTGIATIGWPEDGNQSPQFRSSKRISFLSLGQECTPLFATATCLAINCFPRYISAPVSQSFLSAATRFVIEFSFLIPSPVYHCVFVTIYSCSQLFVPTYFQCRFNPIYNSSSLGFQWWKWKKMRGFARLLRDFDVPPPSACLVVRLGEVVIY